MTMPARHELSGERSGVRDRAAEAGAGEQPQHGEVHRARGGRDGRGHQAEEQHAAKQRRAPANSIAGQAGHRPADRHADEAN